jgi:hypothetical protein
MKEAAVGAVQRAEAVLSALDVQIREEFAVDEQGVAEDFGRPWRLGISRLGIV